MAIQDEFNSLIRSTALLGGISESIKTQKAFDEETRKLLGTDKTGHLTPEGQKRMEEAGKESGIPVELLKPLPGDDTTWNRDKDGNITMFTTYTPPEQTTDDKLSAAADRAYQIQISAIDTITSQRRSLEDRKKLIMRERNLPGNTIKEKGDKYGR